MSKDKKKKDRITFKKCKKTLRPDGLRMKCVQGYTFPDFAEAISSRYPNRIVYSVFRDDTSDMTYSQLVQRARSIASYLIHLGYSSGDKIAIFGESCPNWFVMYLAVTYIGCIAVPVLPDFSEREASLIFASCQVKGACVNQKAFSKIKQYISDNDIDVFRMEDLLHLPKESLGEFSLSAGFSMTSFKYKMAELNARKPKEDDIASLIYTSGTTGASKGVVLTHINILRCADLASDVYVKIKPGYNVLSILPMSHVYEFTIGQILTMMRGCHITFLGKPPAVSILMPALDEIRPHIMLTVPLLIEKVYKAAVLPVIRDNKKIRRLLKSPLKSYVYKSIGKKLYATFGHRLKFFGIGGAALDPEVEKFLHLAHFPYAMGYGLTETAPLIAGCSPRYSDQKPGWIGRIVADDDVVLLNRNADGIGEIAVKGLNVMSGYYNNPELNKEAFTDDGYFKTGDLGQLDRNNRLAIRGRVKTMILGPGGENIYPESIESLINNMNFVQESLVVPSDGGLMALIKLDLKAFANKMKLDIDDAALEARKYLAAIRKDVNTQLSSFSRISDVELQEEDFERTPTQKIKRFLYNGNRDRKDAVLGDGNQADSESKGAKLADKVEDKNKKRSLKKEHKSNKRKISNCYKSQKRALSKDEKKDKKHLLKSAYKSDKENLKDSYKHKKRALSKNEGKEQKHILKSKYKSARRNLNDTYKTSKKALSKEERKEKKPILKNEYKSNKRSLKARYKEEKSALKR